MNGPLIADQALQIAEVLQALGKRHISYKEAQRLIANSARSIIKLTDYEGANPP